MHGLEVVGSLSSHHQSDQIRMNVMYHVRLLHRIDFSSWKDQGSSWRPFAKTLGTQKVIGSRLLEIQRRQPC